MNDPSTWTAIIGGILAVVSIAVYLANINAEVRSLRRDVDCMREEMKAVAVLKAAVDREKRP